MRVIVIGGGVAGAAGAVALRRIGAEVTVYEAYADPAGEVGSFLSLAVNGLRGLDALGCLETVRRAGFAVPRQRLLSETGKQLGDTPRGRLPGDSLMSVTLMRGRLVEALRAEAVRAGARIVTGERLVGAATEGTAVRAEFDSGLTAEADLLVGADGIWSATRRILDPEAPEPRYAGLFSASGVARGVDVEPGVFTMVFGRNGAFIYLAAPDGAVWWAAQVASPRQPDPASVDLDLLERLYRREHMPAAVLAATTERHRPTLMHVLPEVPVWRADRTVLVGDAAHPVGAGQGASMAIEDAIVLARTLQEADVPAALAQYERRRRARVAQMVRSASANRDAKTAGFLTRKARNLVMPAAMRLFYERGVSWLYSHDVAEGWRPTGHDVPSRT
ncbi:2-polyprenyl-6-methoxyphenol hydroxylase-like FAD-dependent oxidoreductase [Actinomadura coerulea]|uniref:2-polyprenyl-6-methoxyphenol hydroxylase-like FAD-dependent oxidoreductase n=1 Tax=Actinomadura coerulea TaxID=46159 RepID=A0A7X0FXG7_9ACTN|nr:2-polyprenyl-6-methoxyphenol hydroxylase-like FAD-dependent oxidoreductase [Actinomadura coerulea]GGQ45645.1 FAD-dependent oxidoreductase [Actinomadura coerulea]